MNDLRRGRAASRAPAIRGDAKLLCDEMLQGLGRWLRAAGYDTAIAGGGKSDRDVLAWATREGRLLLTRDRAMGAIDGAAARVLVLNGGSLHDCAIELRARAGIDWLRRPFTRCVVCNETLAPAPQSLLAAVPADLAGAEVNHCPRCWKPFWSGGHVKRMRRRLQTWSETARA